MPSPRLVPLPLTCPGLINRRDNAVWVKSRTDTTLQLESFSEDGYYSNILKTKQNKYQNTKKPFCWTASRVRFRQELVCEWQRLVPCPCVLSHSAEGIQAPVRCSRHESQPTFYRPGVRTRCLGLSGCCCPQAVWTACYWGSSSLKTVPSETHEGLSPWALRTCILQGFHTYLEKLLLICYIGWSGCGPHITCCTWSLRSVSAIWADNHLVFQPGL